MSILKTINSSEAKLFERFSKYIISGFVYYQPSKMPDNFLTFSEMSLLTEIGLIHQVNHHPALRTNPGIIIDNPDIGFLGYYCGYLLYVFWTPKKTSLSIPCVPLSKVAIELSRFVNQQKEKDDAYLSCLSRFIKSQNLQLKAKTAPPDINPDIIGYPVNETGKKIDLDYFNNGENIN